MQTRLEQSLLQASPANNSGLSRPGSVGDVIRPSVKVPCWFSVAAALRVARLKQAEYLLVLDRQSPCGTISVRTLQAAPGFELLARWMRRCETTLTPETSSEEAYRTMSALGVECLPVASGALLLGLAAREDLHQPLEWEAAAE
jgi:Mg/Co/Ni transporter MgtE